MRFNAICAGYVDREIARNWILDCVIGCNRTKCSLNIPEGLSYAEGSILAKFEQSYLEKKILEKYALTS